MSSITNSSEADEKEQSDDGYEYKHKSEDLRETRDYEGQKDAIQDEYQAEPAESTDVLLGVDQYSDDLLPDREQSDDVYEYKHESEGLRKTRDYEGQKDTIQDESQDEPAESTDVPLGIDQYSDDLLPDRFANYALEYDYPVHEQDHTNTNLSVEEIGEDFCVYMGDRPTLTDEVGFGVLTRAQEMVSGEFMTPASGVPILNGYGIQVLENVETYEGQWANGRRHGFGKVDCANGVVYLGCWAQGRFHGLGAITSPLENKEDRGWFVHGEFYQALETPDRKTPFSFDPVPYRRKNLQPELGLTVLATYVDRQRELMLRKGLNRWRKHIFTDMLRYFHQARIRTHEAWGMGNIRMLEAQEDFMEQQIQEYLRDNIAVEELEDYRNEILEDDQQEKNFQHQLQHTKQTKVVATLCQENQSLTLLKLEEELAQLNSKVATYEKYQEEALNMDKQIQKYRKQIQKASIHLNTVKSTSVLARPLRCVSHSLKGIRKASVVDENANVPIYVCGIAGCLCGIPSDTFLRLGGLLSKAGSI